MTVSTTVKRTRRQMQETFLPDLELPWYVEAFSAIVAPFYLMWLGLSLRWRR